MNQPLLSGQVDDRDTIILGLREQVRQLNEDLRTERSKAGQSESGVKELRHILTPLYRGLQKIFGEIDDMGLTDSSSPTQGNPKWDLWKKRFPGRGAECIDTLLVHEQMNTKQLSTALKCDPRTLAQLIYKLNQAGLIQKNGNMYSLKEL